MKMYTFKLLVRLSLWELEHICISGQTQFLQELKSQFIRSFDTAMRLFKVSENNVCNQVGGLIFKGYPSVE